MSDCFDCLLVVRVALCLLASVLLFVLILCLFVAVCVSLVCLFCCVCGLSCVFGIVGYFAYVSGVRLCLLFLQSLNGLFNVCCFVVVGVFVCCVRVLCSCLCVFVCACVLFLVLCC